MSKDRKALYSEDVFVKKAGNFIRNSLRRVVRGIQLLAGSVGDFHRYKLLITTTVTVTAPAKALRAMYGGFVHP